MTRSPTEHGRAGSRGIGAQAAALPEPLGSIVRAGALVILRGSFELAALERSVEVLVGEGLDCIEVTLNSPSALDILPHLRTRFAGRACLGAGTVRSATDVELAAAAGAEFLVAPWLDRDAVARAKALGRPLIPGVYTASEVGQAQAAGCALLKLFPSEPAGPAYLEALRAPLPEAAFVPTGGIDLDNAGAYLRAGAVALGIGSSLTRHVHDADALAATARRFRDIIDANRVQDGATHP